MLRFAVCDDEKHYLEAVTSATREILSECRLQAKVSAFSSGEALLTEHRADPFDALILDIDMPQMSGFDIAKAYTFNPKEGVS